MTAAVTTSIDDTAATILGHDRWMLVRRLVCLLPWPALSLALPDPVP
jgi:hypothetical protein